MNNMIFPLITDKDAELPFFLCSIGLNYIQEHVKRNEGYFNYHWLHCSKGKGMLLIEDREFLLDTGTAFFSRPGIRHEYYPLVEPWETNWLTFNGMSSEPVLNYLGFKQWNFFQINLGGAIERHMESIFQACKSPDSMKAVECSFKLYQFIIIISQYILSENQNTQSSCKSQLQPVINYIEKNFNKAVSLNEMADSISVTPQHLCRIFKQVYGLRPFEYLTRYRLQKAKELILSVGAPAVKDVSRQVGYNDVSYFCAVFRDNEGLTPSEFRKMYKK